jgi:peptide/nickel transport system permease protein
MWRSWLWRIAQLVLSLICAVLLSCALSALSRPAHGAFGYGQNLAACVVDSIHGRFGISSVTLHPALADVFAAWPVTLGLLLSGGALALALGIPLGILLTNRMLLRIAGPLIQIVSATPLFAMCLLFAWWNTSALGRPLAGVLPSLIIGGVGAGYLQIALRRAVAVASNVPHRRGLRMMGLSALDVDLRYVLPEIAADMCVYLGAFVLVLLGAIAIVEFSFGIPGAASLFFASAVHRDWSVIALVLLSFAAAKLIADFLGWAIEHSLVKGRG